MAFDIANGFRIDLRLLVSFNKQGGLRGGISVALALTLQPSPYRDTLLAVCYGTVVFTILVQGLTMPMLVRRLYRPGPPLQTKAAPPQ